jgi:hypothetical protein
VGRWDQNGSWGDWLGGCALNSTSSGQGLVVGCCVCGDEPSGSGATESRRVERCNRVSTVRVVCAAV